MPRLVTPCQQAAMFRQQRLQTLHIIVVDRAVSLGQGPFEAVARAFQDFFTKLPPTGETIFAGQRELGVAI